MKVVAVNGSPRKNRNTGQLLDKMLAGAAEKGAQTERFDLYSLNYKGCISCFQCKLVGGKSYGRCAMRDGLTPLLEAAHAAEMIILGAPIYFNAESAMMRACMERLWFQYHIYSKTRPSLAPRKHATALLYTMNIPAEAMPAYQTDMTVEAGRKRMEHIFGSCRVFLATNTKQMDDYSKYEMEYFDPAVKDKRHAEFFPQELERAREFGARLVL